ncbi:MAG: hypothetical protein U5K75_00165 [Ahrensia sp.]|nr:hypothetical protein [Ahrensia sp.]
MSIANCLRSAVEQGAINQRQAEELESYYNARFKQNNDAKAARDAVSAELRATAKLKRRNTQLADAKRSEIAQYLKTHKNYKGNADLKDAALNLFMQNGTGNRSSIAYRADAILSLQFRALTDTMEKFRRGGFSGRRINQIDLPDLIKELYGESTGKPEFRAMADGIRKVTEALRQRFNAAGGDMPKREGYDLPHSHDARAIKKLGDSPDAQRNAWKKIIKPFLNPDLMKKPAYGGSGRTVWYR